MKTFALTAALLCATTTELTVLDDVELRPKAAEGVKRTTTFSSAMHMELQGVEMTFVIDGEEHEVEAPEVSMVMEQTETQVFTDEYLAVEDGRATRLRRHFDTLAETSSQSATDEEGETDDTEEEGESGLDARTVVLVWDADEETWNASYAEDEEDADEDLLAELGHYADLAEFLPDGGGSIEVGAEWSVPLRAFTHLGAPSGEVHLVSPSDEEDDDSSFDDAFEEHLAGEILAKVTGVEDGRAIIALTFSVTSEFELEAEEQEADEGMTVEVTQAFAFGIELEGTLEWHIKEGRALALHVEGPVELKSTQSQSSDDEGAQFVIHQVQTFEGTFELTYEFD